MGCTQGMFYKECTTRKVLQGMHYKGCNKRDRLQVMYNKGCSPSLVTKGDISGFRFRSLFIICLIAFLTLNFSPLIKVVTVFMNWLHIIHMIVHTGKQDI